jgi:HK97 gp10 family phage protein
MMAAKTIVTITGVKELENALAELPKATGKNVLRRVLLKRAKPMAEHMRSMAPDDPVTHGYDLRNSITASTRLSPRQAGLHKKMFKEDKASAEVFVGAGPVPHAHMQEFGTVNHGPQAFVRPAWDAGAGPLLVGIKDDLWIEIKKSAARLAKRKARLAEKAAAQSETDTE